MLLIVPIGKISGTQIHVRDAWQPSSSGIAGMPEHGIDKEIEVAGERLVAGAYQDKFGPRSLPCYTRGW